MAQMDEPATEGRRLRLSARLAGAPASPPVLEGSRQVRPADREALARLMLEAYRGTVDDEGGTLDDALAEVDLLLAGGYGAFDEQVSEVVEREDGIVAATLVTTFEGRPFVAFSMTHPAWQRRGLGRAGLARAMASLGNRGERSLDLVVTASNLPAVRLYRSLGFAERPSRGGA